MANTFAYANWITMTSLRELLNKLGVAKQFNTDLDDDFNQAFPIGTSVRKRKPQKFNVRTDLTYNSTPTSLVNRYTTINIDKPRGVDFEWNSQEEMFLMERGEEMFRKRFIVPAMNRLAQYIDTEAALFAYQNTPNIAGTLGTDPTNTNFLRNARTQLLQLGCPTDSEWRCFLNPPVMEAIGNGSTTLFNPTGQVSAAFTRGAYTEIAGFALQESMSLAVHTAGTVTANTFKVNTAPASGDTTLSIKCTSGDTLKAGDVVSIAGRFKVNPETRQAIANTPFTFVVAADFTASGSTGTISINVNGDEGIIGPASVYQNISSLPATDDVLTLFPGTTSPNGKAGVQGLAFQRDAFCMLNKPFPLPKTSSEQVVSQVTDPDTGISMAFVRHFNFSTLTWQNRLDTYYGFGAYYPANCAVRILGA